MFDVSKTVLIVEDHPLVAKFYRMALERAGGFTCVITEDANEILAAVESGNVSLVLLDVSLLGTEFEGRPIDGIELAKILKERAPGRLPILLATAHAMAGDRDRAMEAGCDDYDTKPVEFQRLLDKITALVGPVPLP